MSETLRSEAQSLLRTLIVRVPGADLDLVKMQLGDALREFTRNSLAWQERQTLTTVVGAPSYTLPSPCPDSQVAWLLAATTDRCQLGLYVPPYGESVPPSSISPSGPPTQVGCPMPGLVSFTPTPDAEYQVEMIVALIATSLDAPLPPGFLALYHDALSDGTLHRIYGMPGMPWTSTKLADYHGKRFRRGIADARIATGRTLARGFQPVHYTQRPAGTMTR